MRVLITKPFQDTPNSVLYPFEVLKLWDTTAERAIKEGKAVAVPEDTDAQAFKDNYIQNLTLKNKKGQ